MSKYPVVNEKEDLLDRAFARRCAHRTGNSQCLREGWALLEGRGGWRCKAHAPLELAVDPIGGVPLARTRHPPVVELPQLQVHVVMMNDSPQAVVQGTISYANSVMRVLAAKRATQYGPDGPLIHWHIRTQPLYHEGVSL